MTVRPILAYSRPDTVAESNHRIANHLSMVASLVRMQASSVAGNSRPMDSADLRAVLEELCGRVDTVARLHRPLADKRTDATIELGEYLQDISSAVVAALSLNHIQLHFVCDGSCHLPPESALPVGLIVVELVTNSIKYAHPAGVAGEILIRCSKGADGTITVEVSDDGVGLPEGFDPMREGSLGLRLVRSLAEHLTARIGFPQNPLGLSCILQVPGKVAA